MGAILIGHKVELPYDILFSITNQLPKSDWKALRLLSRAFNNFATQLPFFNDLWFSPHAEDLVVFQGVALHPVWAKQVTTLIYDKSMFADLALDSWLIFDPKFFRNDPDYERVMTTHPGPIAYIRHARDQISTNEQIHILTEGLRKLPNASRFRISWQFGGKLRKQGEFDPKYRSPLARGDWASMHYPAEAFAFEMPLFGAVQTAFGNITDLKLRIDVLTGAGAKKFLPFSKLLRKAEKLETLCLYFVELDIDRVKYPQDFEWQQNNRLDLKTLFGDTTFPRLQFLRLKGLHITARSMEEFLNRHRRSLRRLGLENRYLSSSEKVESLGFLLGSQIKSVREQALFAKFLSKLATGLVDGMKLGSSLGRGGTVRKHRRHLGGGIYLADWANIGLPRDGWSLDTDIENLV